MFTLNDDLSIYATRGDIVFFSVSAQEDGKPYKFQAGDVVRIKIFGKKDAETVLLQKDFPVLDVTEKVEIFLSEADTKIGEVISKPKDYWYEVELNPGDDPQTIIGYDEDGAKVFRLFPEGDDIPEYVPSEEEVGAVDTELDMTSNRAVANSAVAKAFANLESGYEAVHAAVAEKYVTPQMFGAIADGVADDTESIRAAIQCMPDSVLYFPAGTYLVSGDLIVDTDNAEICITEDATIICNVETPTGGVLQCIGYYGQVENTTDTTPRRSGLHIYGGGKVISNDANTNAIGFGRWDNVLIENVRAESQRKGITGQFGGSNITVRECNVYGNTIAALTMETEMSHIVIDNCVMTADGDEVRNINIHSEVDDVVIRNCNLTAKQRNIRFSGVTNALVTGCVCTSEDTMCIDINAECDAITVENCALTATTYGVYAAASLNKAVFNGNRVNAGTGFYIASPADIVHILNNYCTGTIYNVSGTGSVNPIVNGNVGKGISGYAPVFGCNAENGKQVWYEDTLKRSKGGKPTTGTHLKGEIVYNNDCNAGAFLGWICTATGTPGTWKGFGQVES